MDSLSCCVVLRGLLSSSRDLTVLAQRDGENKGHKRLVHVLARVVLSDPPAAGASVLPPLPPRCVASVDYLFVNSSTMALPMASPTFMYVSALPP